MADDGGRERLDGLQHSYDETPYLDQHYPLFTLDLLLGHAQLFGLAPPGATSRGVRVLDLGCASGHHVRSEAKKHPEARFTGVDFSTAEIELGRKALAEDRTRNVELVAADLRSIEVEAGVYDVVLCHGVFSWVPDEVKERILMIARRALAPTGVAAIAYLTYPGWKQREAVRELLLMNDRRDAPAAERLQDAARMLRVLRAGYLARKEDPHAAGLLAVVESMQQSPENAFLHDELGGIHDPCYFLQFVEWAGECGLAYLAEADLGTMSADTGGAGAAESLDQLAPDLLEAQQLVDFVVNRSGRASLLVRDDARPDHRVGAAVLEALHFGTRWWNVTPLNAGAAAPCVFESPTRRRLETRDERVVAILRALTADRTHALSWHDLIVACGAPAEPGVVERTLGALIAQGIVEPRAPRG